MGITARLKEPSTWAGLAVMAMVAGVNPTAVQAVAAVANVFAPLVHTDGGVIAQVVLGLASLGAAGAAVAIPEKKPFPASDA